MLMDGSHSVYVVGPSMTDPTHVELSEGVGELEQREIDAILRDYDDPFNNGAGHHSVVFARKQLLTLLAAAHRAGEVEGGKNARKELLDELNPPCPKCVADSALQPHGKEE